MQVVEVVLTQFSELKDVTAQYGRLRALNHRFDMRNKWMGLAKRYNYCDRIDTAKQLRIIDKSLVIYRRYIIRRVLNHWRQLYRWHHFANFLRRSERRNIVQKKFDSYKQRVRSSYRQKWKKLANSLLVRNRNTHLIKDFDLLHNARRKKKFFEKWVNRFRSKLAIKRWERLVSALQTSQKKQRFETAQEQHAVYVEKTELKRRIFMRWRYEMYMKVLECPLMCKAVLRLAFINYRAAIERQSATKIQKVLRGFIVRKRLSMLLRCCIIWKTRLQLWDSFGIRGERLGRGYHVTEIPINWFDLSKFVGNGDLSGLASVNAILDGKQQLAEQEAVMELSRNIFSDDASKFVSFSDGEPLAPIEQQRVFDRTKVNLLQLSFNLYSPFTYSPVTLVEMEIGELERIELLDLPVTIALPTLQNFSSTGVGDVAGRYMSGLFDDKLNGVDFSDATVLDAMLPNSMAATGFVNRMTDCALSPLLLRCPYVRPRDIFEDKLPFQLNWGMALLPIGSSSKINPKYWRDATQENVNTHEDWHKRNAKPLNVFTASLKRDQLQKSGMKCRHTIKEVGEVHAKDFKSNIRIGHFRKEIPDHLKGYSSLCEILMDPLPVNMKLLIHSKSESPLPILLESYEYNNLGAFEQVASVSPVCYYPIGRVPRSTRFPPDDVGQQELNCYDCVRQIRYIGGFQAVGRVGRRLRDVRDIEYSLRFVPFPCDACSLRFRPKSKPDSSQEHSDYDIGVMIPPFDAGQTPMDKLSCIGEKSNLRDADRVRDANDKFIEETLEDGKCLGLEFEFVPELVLSMPLDLLGLFERKISGLPLQKQTETALIDLALTDYAPDIGFFIHISANRGIVCSLTQIPGSDSHAMPVIPYAGIRDAIQRLAKTEKVTKKEISESYDNFTKQRLEEFGNGDDVIVVPNLDDLPLDFHIQSLLNMFYVFIPFAPTESNFKYLLEDYILRGILDNLPLIYDPIDDELCAEIALCEIKSIGPGTCLLPESEDAFVPLQRLKMIDVRRFVTRESVNQVFEMCLNLSLSKLPIERNIATEQDIAEIVKFDTLEEYNIASTEETIDILFKYKPKDALALIPRSVIDHLLINCFPELPLEPNTLKEETPEEVVAGLDEIVSLVDLCVPDLHALEEFVLVDHVEEVDEEFLENLVLNELDDLPITPNCVTDEPDIVVRDLADILTPSIIPQVNPAVQLKQLTQKLPLAWLQIEYVDALTQIALEEAIGDLPIEENDYDNFVALEVFHDVDLYPYCFVDSMKDVTDPINAYELKDPAAIVTPGIIGAILVGVFPDLPLVPNAPDEDDIEDIVSILQIDRNARALVRLESRIDINFMRQYKAKDILGYVKAHAIDKYVMHHIMSLDLPIVPNVVTDEPKDIVSSINLFPAITSLVPRPAHPPLREFERKAPAAISDWGKVILVCDFMFRMVVDALPIVKNECRPETFEEIACVFDEFSDLTEFGGVDIDSLVNYEQAPIPVTDNLCERIVNGIMQFEGEESILREDRLFDVNEFSRLNVTELVNLKWDLLPIPVSDDVIQGQIYEFFIKITETLPICANDIDELLPKDVVSGILTTDCVRVDIDVKAIECFTDLDYCLPYDRGILDHTIAGVILDVIDTMPLVPNDIDSSLTHDILFSLNIDCVKEITPHRNTKPLQRMTPVDMPIPVNDDFFRWFLEVILRHDVLPFMPLEQIEGVPVEESPPHTTSHIFRSQNLLDGIMDELVDDL